MILPCRARVAFQKGQELAARIAVQRSGWHGWLWICPRMHGGLTFAQQVERWTLTRTANGPYDDVVVGYRVRYVELSDWHLVEEWAADLDIAMQQRPVVDWQVEVPDEGKLAWLLSQYLTDLGQLYPPHRVCYPHPPTNTTETRTLAEVIRLHPGPAV